MICLLDCVAESKDRLRVGVVHFKPERLTAEKQATGYLLPIEEKDLPVPEQRVREASVLYFNPTTKALWLEYVARPPTQEEVLTDLSTQLAGVQGKLDTVLARLDAMRA